MTAQRNWPRLSQTLTGPKHPLRCQACGHGHSAANPLARWQECDERDRPERVVIVLCQRCADQIIEPHPRLYRTVEHAQPWPGCMSVCATCAHRSGVACTSPAIKDGGEGLQFHPLPRYAHVCRSPRRLSGIVFVGEPVKRCSGFEAAQEVSN